MGKTRKDDWRFIIGMRNLIIAFSIMLLGACKSNGKLQPKGDDRLQGIWQEQKSTVKDSLLSSEYMILELKCDSFYLTLNVFSKDNVMNDTCFGNGNWKEYAKGTYLIKDDTIALMGSYTKSNFKQKISGCYRSNYLDNYYVMRSLEDQKMVLSDVRGHGNFSLLRTKKSVCIQKEIF